MSKKNRSRKQTHPRTVPQPDTDKPQPATSSRHGRSTWILSFLVVVLLLGFHHQSRKLARYEAEFVSLSLKSGQLYLATLRQQIEWLTLLTEHGIVDPVELENAEETYRQAVHKEDRKAGILRERHGY